MTDSAVEINVETPPEAPVDTADDTTVVVVNTPDDNDNQDMSVMVGELRAEVEHLKEQLAATEIKAEVAEIVADSAQETANEALLENDVEQVVIADVAEQVEETQEVTEDIVEDNPPAKLPWTHRPMRGFFARD